MSRMQPPGSWSPAESPSRRLIEQELAALRQEFQAELDPFLVAHGLEGVEPPRLQPGAADARPMALVTGINYTPFEDARHSDANSVVPDPRDPSRSVILNTAAAVLLQLVEAGMPVVAHAKSPAALEALLEGRAAPGQVTIVSGDLTETATNRSIAEAIGAQSRAHAVSEVRMVLYNSFAQNNGSPFKPLHREAVGEVERAAARRLRFAYNMSAMGYFLMERAGQPGLRVVSLAALAASRASYGLMADACDKFTCELAWKTFHAEANAHTGRPVTVVQVNPGIVAAGDVYADEANRRLVVREAIADGHPLSNGITAGVEPLPQLNAGDVASIVAALVRVKDGGDPNDYVSPRVAELLTAGRPMAELRAQLHAATQSHADGSVSVGLDHALPDYAYAPGQSWGRLPQMEPGRYRRVAIAPPGQRF